MPQENDFDAAKIHFLNGINALERKSYEEAEAEFQNSLTLLPLRVSTLTNLSAAQIKLGKHADALSNATLAVKIDQDNWEGWLNIGIANHLLDNHIDALAAFEKSLIINSLSADAWSGKGMVLSDLKQSKEALACIDKAISLVPDSPDFLSNKAAILNECGQHLEAIAYLNSVLMIDNQYAEAWHNLGLAHMHSKNYSEALYSFDQAIAINPHDYDAFFNKGLITLTLGDFQNGWDLYEYRWKTKKSEPYRYRQMPTPNNLEEMRDRKILIWHEQGFGDSIQFSRYIKLLEDLGCNITFEVQEPLVRLFKGSFNCEVVHQIRDIEDYDFQIPLLSLPRLFASKMIAIPPPINFLNNIASKATLELQRIRPNIGIAISGNKEHRNDHNRSVPLSYLVPLTPHANLILIQKELKSTDAELAEHNPNISFAGNRLTDFYETARVVNEMDLIITVDTALVHLAGSLGKKTFLMLPWEPEWRWQLDRNDTSWYESVRVFRQKTAGNWDSLIEEIIEKLQ